jgi:hypothetical protein
MKIQAYLDLQKRHEQELTDFPIAYAFSDKQLEEALEKLGAEKSECVTVFGHGDIVKRTDVPALMAMLKRHIKELHDALQEDEEFAEAAFLYEMDNHEYAINWDGDADVMACFNLDEKKLVDMGLAGAYRRARKAHMKHAEEWEMI